MDTAKHKAEIEQYKNKWLDIGFATEDNSASQAQITESLAKCYDLVNVKFPNRVVFTESPYQNGVAYAFLKEVEKRDGKITDDNVQKVIQRMKDLPPSDQLEKDAGFKKKYGDDIKNSTWQSCYGSHDAHWLAYYDFAENVLNDDYKHLHGLIEMSMTAGWFMPFEEVCIVSKRPSTLCWKFKEGTDTRILHNEDGKPAISWNDGYKVYCYNGTLLPEKYGCVDNAGVKAEWILEESNAELRRCLLQRLGPERMVKELNAKEIDRYREYTLFSVDQKISNGRELSPVPIKLLSMTCHSTDHPHVLRVKPDEISARQAIKWVNWGVDCEDFACET